MWMKSLGLISSILLARSLEAYAANFTFTYGEANQCDDFQVSWNGGQPPFRLTILPSLGVPIYRDIPDSNFKSNSGSFTSQLNLAQGRQMVVFMSDASGQASGGISKVITVGKSPNNSQCDLSEPHPDFLYQTNSALMQCRIFVFSDYVNATLYDNATQPVVINGFVPGGTSFILTPPKGPSFSWQVNVAAGTTIAFTMVDAIGKQGGTSGFTVVGPTDDSTCVNDNSPSLVANPPTSTVSTATEVADSTKRASNVIGGAVGGAIAGSLVVGALVWFLIRRRDRRGVRVLKKEEIDLMKGDHNSPRISPYTMQSSSSRMSSPPNSADGLLSMTAVMSEHQSTSYQGSSPGAAGSSQYATSSGHGARESISMPDTATTTSNTPHPSHRKTAERPLAPTSPVQTRYVVHRDMEDDLLPPPPEEEVIELPPQYTERRTPPAFLPAPEKSRGFFQQGSSHAPSR